MNWIGYSDFSRSMFAASGLTGINTAAASDLVLTGSIVIETAVSIPGDTPQILLDYHRQRGWTTRLMIVLNAKGRLSVALRQGDVTSHVSVSTDLFGKRQNLRVTYAWDAPKRLGLLTVENIETGSLRQTEFGDPQALPLRDVEQMTRSIRGRSAPREPGFFAVCAGMAPVGFMPTIAENSPVATPKGDRMIEDIRPGDFVLTADNGPKAVRWVGYRDVPAVGGYQPLRLRAPFFGLTRDIIVAPEQRILVAGAQIEYQFGMEEVLVEAQHLVNGVSVMREKRGPFVRYYQILLDQHEILQVAGADLESLYIGGIRDNRPLLDTTILRNMPRQLIPDHDGPARQILKDFEALTLQIGLAC